MVFIHAEYLAKKELGGGGTKQDWHLLQKNQ